MQKLKKATFTALAIIPKDVAHFQQIREIHDPAFERWPPHINICFPFVNPSEFDIVYNVLNKRLSEFPAFTIDLSSYGTFQKKTSVLFVQPKSENNSIEKIHSIICEIYPELERRQEGEEEGFHPHLTLGKFQQKEIKKALEKFSACKVQSQYFCDEIHFLERDKETPMEIVRTIKLKREKK